MVIDPVALSALNEWMDAAFANSGVTDVNIISSFRSEAEQQSLYDNALQSKGQAYADKYFMRPGYSEHHTGLALDLSLYDTETGLSADFPGSASQQWAAAYSALMVQPNRGTWCRVIAKMVHPFRTDGAQFSGRIAQPFRLN